MPSRCTHLLLVVALVLACGESGPEISSPCDLADAAMVEAAFGATTSQGVEGELRNCDFQIEDGSAPTLTVFDYGDADEWDGAREGYVENRGGVTDLEGIGDAAFYPNDAGASELVVQAGGRIFSVTLFTGLEDPSTGQINALADLAIAIAQRLGS